jgi:hypothetical protein
LYRKNKRLNSSCVPQELSNQSADKKNVLMLMKVFMSENQERPPQLSVQPELLLLNQNLSSAQMLVRVITSPLPRQLLKNPVQSAHTNRPQVKSLASLLKQETLFRRPNLRNSFLVM